MVTLIFLINLSNIVLYKILFVKQSRKLLLAYCTRFYMNSHTTLNLRFLFPLIINKVMPGSRGILAHYTYL